MCAFFLPIAEAAGAATEFLVEEVGFNEFVAKTGVAAAATKTAEYVDEKASELLDNALNNVLGEENKRRYEKALSSTKQDAYATVSALYSQDPKYLVERHRQKMKEQELANQKKIEEKVKENNVVNADPIKIVGGNAINTNYGAGDGLITLVKKEPVKNIDLLGQLTNDKDLTKPESYADIQKSFSSKELADILVSHTSSIASGDGDISKVIGVDKNALVLGQKLTNFYSTKLANKTVDNRVFEIAKTYNLNGKKPSDVVKVYDPVYKGNRFDYTDQAGRKLYCYQLYNYYLPPVYGIWGGPFSRDYDLPIDMPDLSFYEHDSRYTMDGFFNPDADLILVAELLSLRESGQWPAGSENLLNSIVIYFSTLGKSLSYLKGSLPSNVSKQIISDTSKDDIFPVLVPDSLALPEEEYVEARFNFYNTFEEELKHATRTKSIFSSQGPYRANLLKSVFNKIYVELF